MTNSPTILSLLFVIGKHRLSEGTKILPQNKNRIILVNKSKATAAEINLGI